MGDTLQILIEGLEKSLDQVEETSRAFIAAREAGRAGDEAARKASVDGRRGLSEVLRIRRALDSGLASDEGHRVVGRWIRGATTTEWQAALRNRADAALIPDAAGREQPLTLRELANKEAHQPVSDGGFRVRGPDHYLVFRGTYGRQRWIAEYRVSDFIDAGRAFLAALRRIETGTGVAGPAKIS